MAAARRNRSGQGGRPRGHPAGAGSVDAAVGRACGSWRVQHLAGGGTCEGLVCGDIPYPGTTPTVHEDLDGNVGSCCVGDRVDELLHRQPYCSRGESDVGRYGYCCTGQIHGDEGGGDGDGHLGFWWIRDGPDGAEIWMGVRALEQCTD